MLNEQLERRRLRHPGAGGDAGPRTSDLARQIAENGLEIGKLEGDSLATPSALPATALQNWVTSRGFSAGSTFTFQSPFTAGISILGPAGIRFFGRMRKIIVCRNVTGDIVRSEPNSYGQ